MRVLGLNERDSLCPLSARTAWDAEGWNKPTGVGLGLEAHVGTCSFKMCVCAHNPVFFFFFFENIYIREYVLYIYSLGTARLKQIKDVSPLPGSWGGGWGFFNFLKQTLHPQWEWGGADLTPYGFQSHSDSARDPFPRGMTQTYLELTGESRG